MDIIIDLFEYGERTMKSLSIPLLLVVVLILAASNAISDDPIEEWVAYYSGSVSYSGPYAIAVDGDGYTYVTGYSYQGGSQSVDYATIKYNSNGIEEWVALYDGGYNDSDYPMSMTLSSSGNVYVTGKSQGSGTDWDYATVKYSSDGSEQWVARYHGVQDNFDIPFSIALDDDENVYVTGESDRYPYSSGTDYAYCTIKYNCTGEEQWIALYNAGQYEDRGYSIVVDDDGNVYVTGGSYISGIHVTDFTTIKYDSTGAVKWTADYNSPYNGLDYATAIALDAARNVYVGGSCRINAGTTSDIAIVKYNSDGAEQWVAYYDNGYWQSLVSMVLDDSGNVYAVNSTTGGNAILKYNSDGVLEWAASFDGLAVDGCVDNSGNIYVTGTQYTRGDCDFVTSRYSSDGIEQWTVFFDSYYYDDDDAIAVALDGSGNIYVTGTSVNSSNWDEFATVKYSQVTGIEESQEELQPSIQVYPCPVSTTASIIVTLPEPSDCSVLVYSLDGRLIETLHRGVLPEGEYSFIWQTSQIPVGVYLLRASAGSIDIVSRVAVIH